MVSQVRKQLYTGLKVIDTLHPLGQGHRVAFVGDRGAGKRRAALDLLHAQAQLRHQAQDSTAFTPADRAVYVSVGQSERATQRVASELGKLVPSFSVCNARM